MQVAYNNQEEFSAFSACREQLENIIVELLSAERAAQEHGEVEVFYPKRRHGIIAQTVTSLSGC